MKRIALDTNIVNRIASTTGLIEEICAVAKAGRIIIVGIPTVRNELEQTPDIDHRALLVGVYDQLPREDVLDQASVWNASKGGRAYGETVAIPTCLSGRPAPVTPAVARAMASLSLPLQERRTSW